MVDVLASRSIVVVVACRFPRLTTTTITTIMDHCDDEGGEATQPRRRRPPCRGRLDICVFLTQRRWIIVRRCHPPVLVFPERGGRRRRGTWALVVAIMITRRHRPTVQCEMRRQSDQDLALGYRTMRREYPTSRISDATTTAASTVVVVVVVRDFYVQ